MKFATHYAVALTIFLVLDFMWLSYAARTFYAERIGGLLLDQPRWGVAATFYALWVFGLVWFAIAPAMESGAWRSAAINGALFGFFTYLTYNATNLAVMRGYTPTVAAVDTLWGVFAGATVSMLTIVTARAISQVSGS